MAFFARGWTRSMIERFLVKFDRLGTVNHLQNYYGKAVYLAEHVVAVDCLPQFQAGFAASIKRRKLLPEAVEAFVAERERGNAEYRAALGEMTEADVRSMNIAQSMAGIFDQVRARGYRTPHNLRVLVG